MLDSLEGKYGQLAYATYLATPGIDGKNFQGNPCPGFNDLPEQVQRGWGRAALMAAGLAEGSYDWALAQLQAGKKAARAIWGGYWEMQTVNIWRGVGHTFATPITVAHLKDGSVALAQPYWEDMLATDWRIVE